MFKLNQRGQQFSVFELMIAGIVAFAILMVLLTIIGRVGFDQTLSAKSAVEDGISQALPSSAVTTKNFVLKAGDELTSSDLTNKTNLDPSRIFFVKGQIGDSEISVENNYSGSSTGGTNFMKNIKASGDLKARAKIICKATCSEVSDSLGRLGSKYSVGEFSPGSSEDNQSCCVVVPERPAN
ncbi:MAG: hypothetical protein NTY48_00870 [Candidatus Diapherotrites archaeon]|nr:hypothetical protein [Candidatus Diapherotrites archaeon]